MITRVAMKICGTTNVRQMYQENKCTNFRVMPPEYFYDIEWKEHAKFFEEKFLNETMERLTSSVIAHVWNKHSYSHILSLDAKVAYIKLAKKYCPKVFRASNYF